MRRIRKAYKKKALELHPDRNLDDTATATRKFAEVQTAYEVLSDPQERAWYDSHREAILHGDEDGSSGPEHDGVGITTTEDLFSLMGRFNSSVPFDDSPNGFFGILETTFARLAQEERAACEWDDKAPPEYPIFGASKDPFDSVAKPFYNAWSSFSTGKSFSWKDKYRPSDAPDRRVRRLIEKENKKFRDEAIRDFNDAVRSLVAFVKKRDPRYVPNTQSEAERQKVLRDSAAAQAARSRAVNREKLAEYIVPEWAQSRDDHNHVGEFSMSEDESEVEHIECVVCAKIFKSEKQFEAHQRSKKHTKAVQQLQRQMKRENVDFNLHTAHEAADSVAGGDDNGEVEDGELDAAVEADEADGAPESPSSESREGDDDDDYAPRDAVESRLFDDPVASSKEKPARTEADDIASEMDGLNVKEPPETGGNKVGKAKAKREKKAARQAAGDDSVGQLERKP